MHTSNYSYRVPTKNLSNEKIVYERENQIEAFKIKIKTLEGRSCKDEEIEQIAKSQVNEVMENYTIECLDDAD